MKKIMFNDRYGLTEAVIEKLKEQTRRALKNQSGSLVGQIKYTKKGSDLVYVRTDFDNGISEDCFYAIGEIVAVAQSYKNAGYAEDATFYRSVPEVDGYLKKNAINHKGWNNKMFVCANLMPYQIRILDVKAERLQDIIGEDCLGEGIKTNGSGYHFRDYNFNKPNGRLCAGLDPIKMFASLIDKISGKGTWERNPYVWRIEFELVK